MNDFKKKWRKFWKRFWFFVWKDESTKGWIISLLFLFVLIKFILFPLLSLITGTALPLVIVESCSMYHEDNLFSDLDEWWKDVNLKYSKFDVLKSDWNNFPLKKGFNKGDVLFVVGVKPEKVEIGDVLIFEANYKNPVIHRVIEINERQDGFYFSTIGDNNNGQFEFEENIFQDNVIGKAVARPAPYFGWIKLIFFERLKLPSERGFCKNQ